MVRKFCGSNTKHLASKSPEYLIVRKNFRKHSINRGVRIFRKVARSFRKLIETLFHKMSIDYKNTFQLNHIHQVQKPVLFHQYLHVFRKD